MPTLSTTAQATFIVVQVILAGSPSSALAKRVHDPLNGFSVECPRRWYAAVEPTRHRHPGDSSTIVLTNFRPGGGLLPNGGAEIWVTLAVLAIEPANEKEEQEALLGAYTRPKNLTVSRDPLRAEYEEGEYEETRSHFVKIAKQVGGHRFYFRLVYYERNPRGARYKRLLDDVVGSLRVRSRHADQAEQ